MRRQLAAAAAIFLAVPGLLLSAGPTATAASTPNDLVVDLGSSTGAFDGGASGALYGLYDQGVPSNNLIQGMGMVTTDTKAQDGQQHPGSDALEIAKPFVASGGRNIYIYMTDVYRNFPYERTTYAQYQGYMKTEVEQALTSPYRNRIVLVPVQRAGRQLVLGPDHQRQPCWPRSRPSGCRPITSSRACGRRPGSPGPTSAASTRPRSARSSSSAWPTTACPP